MIHFLWFNIYCTQRCDGKCEKILNNAWKQFDLTLKKQEIYSNGKMGSLVTTKLCSNDRLIFYFS